MDKPWLEQYGSQTVEELIAMQDRYRIDSLLCALEMGIEQTLSRRGIADLSETEFSVLAILDLQREVNNGGYHQFFLNSSARFAHAIVPVMERLECPKHAAIASEALAAAGITENMVGDAISEHVEELDDEAMDRLSACDQRFFTCREDLDGRLFAYVATHQAEIKLPAGG